MAHYNETKDAQSNKDFLKETNKSSDNIPKSALTGDMTVFKNILGPDLIGRTQPFFDWQNNIRESGLWFLGKTSLTAPKPNCTAITDYNIKIEGVNFASQDYLNLSSHPDIKFAAKLAIDEYGVHSAGSPALFGNTKLSAQLESVIGEFLNVKDVILYPTGWGAGYGIIKGLIRPSDYIVMDKLAHACLKEGATAATKNIYSCPHLDILSIEKRLKILRNNDKENAILVITESLFSMDSDVPDIKSLQEICKKYNAWLLVDVAHDLGCIGENGTGFLGIQNMIGKVDIVMGSFSKTFASNGGFVGVNSRAVKEYLTFFSSPRTFSNSLSPVQNAVVLKAFEIIQAQEGKELRSKLMNNICYLRKILQQQDLKFQGDPSAIVPIIIGNEGVTRLTTKLLADKGIITNNAEYPGVPKDLARLRIQVMANHTYSDMDILALGVKSSLEKAKFIYSSSMTL